MERDNIIIIRKSNGYCGLQIDMLLITYRYFKYLFISN
jgi:hypothetical protein